MERQFLVTIVEDDIDEEFKEDLAGNISEAIEQALDAGYSNSCFVEEIE